MVTMNQAFKAASASAISRCLSVADGQGRRSQSSKKLWGCTVIGILSIYNFLVIEGSLEVKLPTIWRDEKQSREEAERRERLEERRVEEKE